MELDILEDRIRKAGVVPVIAIESADFALPLADALVSGGLAVAEITFRTDAAAETIAVLKKKRPDILIGAGTILSIDNLLKATDCGAVFGVSPGLNPAVVEKAAGLGFPFFPGVLTPSEIEQGLSLGMRVLKFFPSEISGGAAMIKSLAAPYAHLGVRFIPTGGVTIDNLERYLALSEVLAVGGTWIAKKDAIAAGRWEEIRSNACEAVSVTRRMRR